MAWPLNARTPLGLARSPALSLLLGIVLVGCGTCSALAQPNDEVNEQRLDGTVRFLQSAQNSDGGFGVNGNVGEPSNPKLTAWVAIALATAGINPQNQAQPGGESAFGYLADHAGELGVTTDFERVLLVVDAAGTSAQDFGGVDLIQAILQRQLPQGGFVHEEDGHAPAINDTVFAILALSPIHEAAVQSAVEAAVQWLEREQNSNGSWPAVCAKNVSSCGADPPGETDMTAAAVEALNAAGMHDTKAQSEALAYLRRAQNPDGGFSETAPEPGEPGGRESDTASTSWAVQAIFSAGENPEGWTQTSSGREPLDYLESMQHENGSIQLSASSDAEPLWMTAYAAPAFALQPLPVPAVPLQAPSSAPAATPPAPTPSAPGVAEAGQGGESSQAGSGVIAGGGGNGAPLFSRPQPQSMGRAPGGVRLLGSEQAEAAERRAARHARKLGRLRNTPAPTVAASVLEPSGKAKGAGAASARAGSGGSATGGALHTAGRGAQQTSGSEVKGVLITAPSSSETEDAPEAGAPGLHSAGVGGNQTPWLAIAIGGLVLALVLAGSQLERRRPQAIL
jgi:hypothetical protein